MKKPNLQKESLKQLRILIFMSALLLTIKCSFSQIGYSESLNSYLSDINSDSLIQSVKKLSGEIPVSVNGQPTYLMNRIWNSPENHLAAQYIYEQFQSLGYNVEYDQFSTEGYNVIATRLGSIYPEKEYILCAHYDNVAHDGQGTIAPGADDNGTGIIAMIKAAEIFTHFDPLYTIKFIAFDAEEEGMVGSIAYASNAAANGDSIVGVINMDMLGWDSNNDFIYLAVRNSQSEQFCEDFINISEIYVNGLHPLYSSIWYSDHSSFWNNGYTAINVIEHHGGDFNRNYHTILDVADSINKPYFLKLTQASIAAFITKACDMYIYCNHEPLISQMNTQPRLATLTVSSEHLINTGNPPKLHFSVNGDPFNTLFPVRSGNDEWTFEIPAAEQGDKIEYFFEVNDSADVFTVTSPYGGQGVLNPPPVLYTYYIADLTIQDYCNESSPKTISHQAVMTDTISIYEQGLITDLNIIVDVKHTYDADLSMTLIDPSGREILLCENNGGYGDNFSITEFDDQSDLSINEGTAPFNGSYRPLDSLAVLEYKPLSGNWILRIEDNGVGDNGLLESWCLQATWSEDLLTGNEDTDYHTKKLLIYPNPASDHFYINTETLENEYFNLSIVDLSGRSVVQDKIKNGELINISRLSPGIYIVNVKTNNHIFQNKLIID